MTEKKYKFSYIPREYYPAVMYAAKMVRESGWFNKACAEAASYYGVNEGKVREYLSRRSQEGRKAKPQAAKKRVYFVVERKTFTREGTECNIEYLTKWGYSKNATEDRLSEGDYHFNRANDYGGYYSLDRVSTIVGEFATQAEATRKAEMLQARTEEKANA